MAFYGSTFVFAGIPCEEHGLIIYDFQSKDQGDAKLTSTGSAVLDQVPSKHISYLYGIQQDEPLEFTLVFGALPNSRQNNALDRWEIDSIATWLTGHNTYQWLEICQPDLDLIRYHCIATSLEIVTYGNLPWAFSCKFQCDSSFAYEYPERSTYEISSTLTTNLINRSSLNGFYYPKMEIQLHGGTAFKITNHSDKDRVFEFKDLPSGNDLTLTIDNENSILSSSIETVNPYEYFNFQFFRMVRGDNSVTFEGAATVILTYEFPVNPGG